MKPIKIEITVDKRTETVVISVNEDSYQVQAANGSTHPLHVKVAEVAEITSNLKNKEDIVNLMADNSGFKVPTSVRTAAGFCLVGLDLEQTVLGSMVVIGSLVSKPSAHFNVREA